MYQVPFLESCPGCGGFTEVYTDAPFFVLNADLAQDGDIVTCTQCGCRGEIRASTDGNACEWQDELCSDCVASILGYVRSLLS